MVAYRFPENFIESVASRTDLVDLVSSKLTLKKSGTNYFGLCPFHNEKSPSFSVNSEKQIYKCFGCGASGDAIEFLINYSNLSFKEAVLELAHKAGVAIPQDPKEYKAAKPTKSLYSVLENATAFYENQLKNNPNATQAKEYLKSRGLTGKIAKYFRVGFAPPGWNNLKTILSSEYTKSCVESGIVIKNAKAKFYDRFRNRIVFPIRDTRARVVGFGGRVLDSNSNEPKYLNSPETPVFNKGNLLYGLYEVKQLNPNFKRLVVVEGYLDVIALHQLGINEAVATLGTALTAQHLQLLFKNTKQVVLCFDGDGAGLKALWRSLELALPFMDGTVSVKFLILPEGEDPDSCVRHEGRDKFISRLNLALSLPDYLFNQLAKEIDLSHIDGRAQFTYKAQGYIAKIPEGVFKTMMMERLGQLVGLDLANLNQQSKGLKKDWGKSQYANKPKPVQQLPVSPAIRAAAILLEHRDLIKYTCDLKQVGNINMVGGEFLLAIFQILSIDQNLPFEEIQDKMPSHLVKYLVKDELRAIAQQIPTKGMEQELKFIVKRIIERMIDATVDDLLTKAKLDGLSVEEKAKLQQLLTDRATLASS